MPLLFLSLIGVPLFLSLGWTHARFKELEHREKRYIALDNASIVLGRATRAALRRLEVYNRWVLNAERAHHTVHACARAGLVPSCAAADAAWESSIHSARRSAWAAADAAWAGAGIASLADAAKLGATASVDRPARFPLGGRICLCGLSTLLFPTQALKATVRVDAFVDRVGWIRQGSEWNYRIEEADGIDGAP